MKKLLLITILFFGLYGYAQKKLEIYNFLPYTVNIHDMTTDASGAYPTFSASMPGGFIALAPGDVYILENVTTTPPNPNRFPFESPGSIPYIPNWIRRTSPTTGTSMTSPTAWVLGNAQVFSSLTFRILIPTSVGSGTVGVANPIITTPNWSAIYDLYTSGTIATYTIVFTP